MAHAVQEFKVQAVAKAERETAEREEKNRELAAARRAELHELAENFETTVGNIIENVGTASDELENSAVVLSESSAATQELSHGGRNRIGRDLRQRAVGRGRNGGDGRLDQRNRTAGGRFQPDRQ